MSYTLRLTFSGLCAFIPNRDWGHSVPPDEITVCLLNSASKNDRLKMIENFPERHVPLLRFELASIAPDVSYGKDCYAYWTLAEEDVWISFRKKDGENIYNTGPLRVVMDGTARSFLHVPSMEDVCSGAGQVEVGSLEKVPRNDLVVARFQLDSGILANDEFGKFRGGEVVVQFVPVGGGGAWRERLPHRVVLEFRDLPEDVEAVVHAEKFNDPDSFRDLILGPVEDPAGNRLVELNVLNLCCGYVLGDKSPWESYPESDRDFECYYVLSREFGELRKNLVRFPIPVPVEHENRDEKVGGGDTIRCSVSRFDAIKVESGS